MINFGNSHEIKHKGIACCKFNKKINLKRAFHS